MEDYLQLPFDVEQESSQENVDDDVVNSSLIESIRMELREKAGIEPSRLWLKNCLQALPQYLDKNARIDSCLYQILHHDLRDVVRSTLDDDSRETTTTTIAIRLRRLIRDSRLGHGQLLSSSPPPGQPPPPQQQQRYKSSHSLTFEAPFRWMVQIEEVVDVSQGTTARLEVHNSQNQHRCLKLAFSDGYHPITGYSLHSPEQQEVENIPFRSNNNDNNNNNNNSTTTRGTDVTTSSTWSSDFFLVAMEVTPIPNLSIHGLPGIKLLLTAPITIRHGILLLHPGNATVLGGHVPQFVPIQKRAWEQAKRLAGVGVDPTIQALIGSDLPEDEEREQEILYDDAAGETIRLTLPNTIITPNTVTTGTVFGTNNLTMDTNAEQPRRYEVPGETTMTRPSTITPNSIITMGSYFGTNNLDTNANRVQVNLSVPTQPTGTSRGTANNHQPRTLDFIHPTFHAQPTSTTNSTQPFPTQASSTTLQRLPQLPMAQRHEEDIVIIDDDDNEDNYRNSTSKMSPKTNTASSLATLSSYPRTNPYATNSTITKTILSGQSNPGTALPSLSEMGRRMTGPSHNNAPTPQNEAQKPSILTTTPNPYNPPSHGFINPYNNNLAQPKTLHISFSDLFTLLSRMIGNPTLSAQYQRCIFVSPIRQIGPRVDFNIVKVKAPQSSASKKKGKSYEYWLVYKFTGDDGDDRRITCQVASSYQEPFFELPPREMRDLSKTDHDVAQKKVKLGGEKICHSLITLRPFELTLLSDLPQSLDGDRPVLLLIRSMP